MSIALKTGFQTVIPSYFNRFEKIIIIKLIKNTWYNFKEWRVLGEIISDVLKELKTK